jgi:D-sedoheptulose 7-phosphate isomerase
MKDLVTRLRSCATNQELASEYISHLKAVLDAVPIATVAEILEAVESAADRGSTIFIIGNGGSASIASHFVNDLVYGTRCEGHPRVRAVSVSDNLAVVTALANDNGYDRCFVIQLEESLRSDDVVIALSVSGNSPNVVEAIRYAREVGATIVSCTGFEGGAIREYADIDLHLDLADGEYGPAEDVFMMLDHLIYSCLRFRRRNAL